jgi:hypothetical protein
VADFFQVADLKKKVLQQSVCLCLPFSIVKFTIKTTQVGYLSNLTRMQLAIAATLQHQK